VITLRKPESGRAHLQRCEDIRTPLDTGLGDAVLQPFRRRLVAADTDDNRLLDTRLVVAADVIEERYGHRSGTSDRHPTEAGWWAGPGDRRGHRRLAGFVGACDGQLTAGQIVSALGVLLEERADQLRIRLALRYES